MPTINASTCFREPEARASHTSTPNQSYKTQRSFEYDNNSENVKPSTETTMALSLYCTPTPPRPGPTLAAPTSAVLLTQVGEPPHVPQAHGEAHLGQDVLQLVVPGRPPVLPVCVGGGQQALPRRRGPGAQAHAHLTALVVHGLLQRQQVRHGLRDGLLAGREGDLAVLGHGGGAGVGGCWQRSSWPWWR